MTENEAESSASGEPHVQSAGFRHHISPPTPLNIRGDLTQRWRDRKQLWDGYYLVTGLAKELDAYRLAVLVNSLGQKALETYNALRFADPADKARYECVIEALENHFMGIATRSTNVTCSVREIKRSQSRLTNITWR
ncbi:uncharacterized protein LOC134189163 [Corticium candelabrum]|uniref:uncharacterized protein LOC134189163 n=1 Tax=Corticium candelabrum TaxID=121492 RepID=UPI002E26B326|nr:uncharacterized protein LOC134189163 [Corticium candelabrum]